MLPNNITSARRRTVKQPRQELEAELDVEIYSGGFFDGLIGSEPMSPEKSSYSTGYQLGKSEYWADKLSVEIPTSA